jgi:O-antigen biosynthesis protein
MKDPSAKNTHERPLPDFCILEVTEARAELARSHASKSWRLTKPLRAARAAVRARKKKFEFNVRVLRSILQQNGGVFGAISKAQGVLRRDGFLGLKRALLHISVQVAGGYEFSAKETSATYREWAEKYDALHEGIRAKIQAHMTTLRQKPLISVVMPVYNPSPEYFDEAIRSVTTQIYPHWELCVADDASTCPVIRQIIERHVDQDSRIKVVYRETNGHICRATNSALELAKGEFVAFLDHDDIIPAHALYRIVAELEKHPDTDILYSDSDLLNDSGERHNPYFKPDFSLELMLGHNLVSHFGVYRRSLVETIGGMRAGFEGSQDYDLILRVLAQSTVERVRHIPTVLYHWRRSKQAPSYSTRELDSCIRTARRAVEEFLSNKGIAADVMPAPAASQWQRVRYHLPEPLPKVSIIIPTKNQAKLLERCVTGLLNATDYQPFEITIVDHDSNDADAMALLSDLAKNDQVNVLRYSGVFSFAAINNFAVRETDGGVLAFLNNDIEVIRSDWLREMVSHAVRPGIAAVGAKLYYPNGNIQHAGIVTGIAGVAGHLYKGAPGDAAGMYGEILLTREISAVTAACMVIRRNVFLDIGGFDEINLAVAFNDVDLCLRLLANGYRNIFTPFAELIHHESATRGSDLNANKRARFIKEYQYMLARWGDILPCDPFFNPNRSLEITPRFAGPPRLSYPWESLEVGEQAKLDRGDPRRPDTS